MVDNKGCEFFLANEEATLAIGQVLSQCLPSTGGATLYLEGQLGAGKTTLTRGLLHALGHSAAVKSPTYTLVEPYEHLSPVVYHFDLYRLGDPEELDYMGIRDYFSPHAICLVEWAERGLGYLPIADLHLSLMPEVDHSTQQFGRRLSIRANTDLGHTIMGSLPANKKIGNDC